MSSLPTLGGDYDYIIVGAGTAGCVLADRLIEDADTRVLLLEAGGSDRYHWVRIPVGYLYCMGNPRTDWMMSTAQEPGLNGRSLAYPRGEVLGGCSSIDGMIYMRGQAADYDHWRQLGNVGWSWDDVLPYFLKSEDHHGGASPMHASGGGWKVSKQRLRWEILEAVQEGAREFGIEPRADFNDGDNEGSGLFEVNQRRGERWNTADGFLRPAMKRPNLRVVVQAETERLVVKGREVRGVIFRYGGRRLRAVARAEVLLAAGSIHSPKILELSGIGQPERLAGLGIDAVHESPGVGENLQDHLQIRTVFKVHGARTLNTLANSAWGKARIALEYALWRSGPLSMAPSQFGMFTKSDPARATPDLEYHVQPLSTDRLGDPLHPFPAITMSGRISSGRQRVLPAQSLEACEVAVVRVHRAGVLDRMGGDVRIRRQVRADGRRPQQLGQDGPVARRGWQQLGIGLGEPALDAVERVTDVERRVEDAPVRRHSDESENGRETQPHDLCRRERSVPPATGPAMERTRLVDRVDEQIDVRNDHRRNTTSRATRSSVSSSSTNWLSRAASKPGRSRSLCVFVRYGLALGGRSLLRRPSRSNWLTTCFSDCPSVRRRSSIRAAMSSSMVSVVRITAPY